MSTRESPEGPVRTAGGALGPRPRICLHDHLDGGVRPATVLDLAREAGHELPASDAESLGRWFRDSANSGSLVRYLETFEHTVAVMQTADALRRVAREYTQACVADGLVHAEVRWAPEQHVAGGLTLDAAVDAVQQGLAEGVEEVRAAGGHLSVVQILCAMRHLERSTEIAELVVRRVRGEDALVGGAAGAAAEQLTPQELPTATSPGRVPGEPEPGAVVAFDLAGPEAGFPASAHREALDLLAAHRIPVTLHAGEADGAASMADALLVGRALRLGHGVRLLDEDPEGTSPLACWIRDRQVALEVCPCSNLQTGASSAWGEGIAEHPVTRLLRGGFAVTISPDNRLMSDTSVGHELEQLRTRAGWSDADVVAVQRNAARAAFVPREYQLWLEEQVTGERV
ncbi:adenosine deaminase [Kocuria salsicia]|uniref:adenosine deaminase family protein n=1 Tax=Kocuria salsicia TaxID=664639 RepID=UPI0031D05618